MVWNNRPLIKCIENVIICRKYINMQLPYKEIVLLKDNI